MCVYIHIEARSRNHCCRGKTKKYYIFRVFVSNLCYPARKEHAPCYVVICGVSGCTVLSRIVS